MNQEIRTCQNCKKDFVIESEDFDFYEKISVPPPTWCPECRFIRRYLWRNERALYKRICAAPGHTEEIISMYAPEKHYTVYDEKYWWSDAWNPLDYGKTYDFSKPFFQQYRELLDRVPLINLSVTNNTDSPYCNVSAWDKGCYMISASGLNEYVFYSNRVANTKDSCDVYISDKNQLCYELVDCANCFRTYFSVRADSCLESYFLYDCKNCQHCFGCVGLRNKNYHVFNQPYTKEEYEQRLKNLNTGSFRSLVLLEKEFRVLQRSFPRRFANTMHCVNVTGDNVKNSKNAKFCFDGTGVEDGKFFTWVYVGTKDSYDIGAGSGIDNERLYECWDTNQSSRVAFSGVIYSCYDMRYSWNCHGSNNCFGCYGLRNKEYCILNRQYAKEEYEKLLPRIIEHMNTAPFAGENGRIYQYGEFIPIEISPFAYNETIAQEYFPIVATEARKRGYAWRRPAERKYTISLKSENIPDSIDSVSDMILNEVIGCAHSENNEHPFFCEASCTEAFRVTPWELAFYKNAGLPLPHLCSNCRHYGRLSKRNPIRLWHRQCMCNSPTCGANREGPMQQVQGKQNVYQNTTQHFHGDEPCPNEFETSYSPDRPEIVYCESCYNSEVV